MDTQATTRTTPSPFFLLWARGADCSEILGVLAFEPVTGGPLSVSYHISRILVALASTCPARRQSADGRNLKPRDFFHHDVALRGRRDSLKGANRYVSWHTPHLL